MTVSPLRSAAEGATRNATARFAGEVAARLIALVLLAAVARTLGEAALGVYVAALAFVQIVTLPLDIGLDRYAFRRMARNRSEADALVTTTLRLKLIAAPFVLGAAPLLALLAGYRGDLLAAVAILAVGFFLDALARTLQYAFNAFRRNDLVAVAIVGQRIAGACLGLLALATGHGIVWVAIAYVAGAAGGFGLSIAMARRSLGVDIRTPVRRPVREVLLGSRTFAAQDALNVILMRSDMVILSVLAATAAVGRYGAAYRLFESTFLIVIAIGSAFSPLFVSLDGATDLRRALAQALGACTALLLPCALVLLLFAGPIASLVFGEDLRDAEDALRLLAPAIPLYGIATLSVSMLLARNPRLSVIMTAAGAVLNVALVLALVPSRDEEGAALAMLITYGALAVAAVAVAWRVAGQRPSAESVPPSEPGPA